MEFELTNLLALSYTTTNFFFYFIITIYIYIYIVKKEVQRFYSNE